LRAWSWRGSSDDLLPTKPIEIERYGGPLFISHGTTDKVWSVDMTKRLAERLRQHGKSAEVHLYEGQDHIPSSAGENEHHELLISFFERHLAN
jgi:dipeptidyl aminopeptidase/acylaminoacyl peptidase